MTAVARHVLPVLVLAQFAGTSPWFAVNAVMPDLQRELGWPLAWVGSMTSALQFGFIAGTLAFALLAVVDRYPPRRVFLLCSLAAAAFTVGAWAMVRDPQALMVWRFATGCVWRASIRWACGSRRSGFARGWARRWGC